MSLWDSFPLRAFVDLGADRDLIHKNFVKHSIPTVPLDVPREVLVKDRGMVMCDILTRNLPSTALSGNHQPLVISYPLSVVRGLPWLSVR